MIIAIWGKGKVNPEVRCCPNIQLNDYRNAISWVSRQAEVDADRIGVWGTSYSGGHVLHLGAFDRRIKAVVSQCAQYMRLAVCFKKRWPGRNAIFTGNGCG